MKPAYYLFLASVLLFSCTKKEDAVQLPPANEANYKVTLQLNWGNPSFTIPVNAHFTNFIGMVHSKDSFLWAPNGLASPGLKFVAEVGSNWRLLNELDTIISNRKALAKFDISAPPIAGGFDSVFHFTLQHSCLSFASMIAPSPDWFAGLNRYDLLQGNQWISSITIPIYLYDAGTEDGDVFGYDNPPTMPQQPVRLLTAGNASVLANGNATLAPIGTLKFVKL